MELSGKSWRDEAPQFELPIENELLMLKLQAEFGAECTTGSDHIPADVVHEFLQSVYEFEKKFREPHPVIRIHDKIGKPYFKKCRQLDQKLLSSELKRLLQLLHNHQIELDVIGTYPDETIYQFITEEFLLQEIEDFGLTGFISHFCYEDFHPNHELDIMQRANEFIEQWFGRSLNEYSWQLAEFFIHPDTRQFTRQEILTKMNNLFSTQKVITNYSYSVESVKVNWDETNNSGTAQINGIVKYTTSPSGDHPLEECSPFEFSLSAVNNWWSIFYFVFPGFNWNE